MLIDSLIRSDQNDLVSFGIQSFRKVEEYIQSFSLSPPECDAQNNFFIATTVSLSEVARRWFENFKVNAVVDDPNWVILQKRLLYKPCQPFRGRNKGHIFNACKPFLFELIHPF